ncbi:MAG: EF-hand domain-containing protein, partial [Hyphomicrobiales bacterium]
GTMMTTIPVKLAFMALVLAGGVLVTTFADAAETNRAEKFFKRVDANNDGTVSREEMLTRTTKRFERIDTDKDGKITEAELLQKIKRNPEKRSKRMMKRMDGNGDGAISRAEFDARANKRFDRVDANKDGAISMAEWEDKRKRAKAKRKDNAASN